MIFKSPSENKWENKKYQNLNGNLLECPPHTVAFISTGAFTKILLCPANDF